MAQRTHRLAGAALVAFVILPLVCNGDPARYSKRTEFSAVSLSQRQLADLATTLLDLIRKANRTDEAKGERVRARLTIGDTSDEITLAGNFDLRDVSRRTTTAYKAEFDYLILEEEAPISKVSLSLTDFYRTLSIEGHDPRQVDAIFAFVVQDIRKRETFGGPFFRFLVAAILLAFAFASVNLKFSIGRPRIIFDPSPPQRLFAWVLFLLLAAVVLFEPFGSWLPGTAVYTGDPSWWNRNAALLTFLGLALSVFSICQAAYLSRRRRKADDDVPTP